MASYFIDQALLIADGISVDPHLYIDMTIYVNKFTTNVNKVMKSVYDIVGFLVDMKSVIQAK